MSRIEQRFNELKAQGRKALIPYVTAGDPEPSVTVDLMHSMVEAGAAVIELGIPFSDPMAGGPVIQLACERALAHNTRLVDVLAMVSEFRTKDAATPVVLMGYLNPIERMGYQAFADAAAQAGVDGVLTVDLPPEESEQFAKMLNQQQMDMIYLLAPTTQESRIKQVCEFGSGYVYYVSVKGVTGSAALDVEEVADKLAIVRKYTDMAIGVGFGIRDGQTAAAISKLADGVIVGSVLVNKIAEHSSETTKINGAISEILTDMRQAMDAVE